MWSDSDTPFFPASWGVTAEKMADGILSVMRAEVAVAPEQVRYLRSRAWRPALVAIVPTVRPVQLLWFELPLMVRPPPLARWCVL